MGWRCVVALVVVAVVVGACSSSDEAAGVVDEDSALAVIEAAYELYNSGDAAGWAEVRDRGSSHNSDEARQEVLDWEVDQTRGEIEAGARYVSIECVSQGLGEWPVADAGPVAGYYFICDTDLVADSDDFVERSERFEWVVSEGPDGAVVAVRSNR